MKTRILTVLAMVMCAALAAFGQSDLLTGDYSSVGWSRIKPWDTVPIGRDVLYHVGYYDVTVDGGTVGSHTLGPTIAEDEIVMQVIFDVYQRIYPATSTNALSMNATGDLLAAGTTLNSVGLKAGVPVDTAGTAVRCTNEWPVAMTISGSAATTGVYKVIIKTYKALPR